MSSEQQCPFCGASSLFPHSEQKKISVPYGPDVSYESTYLQCGECDEQVATDEDAKERARKESVERSVDSMLDHLSKRGVSAAYFERALRIPQRTTTRWKDGQISASALALLRMVRTYPWLLKLADCNFAPEVSYQLLLGEATRSSGVKISAQSNAISRTEGEKGEAVNSVSSPQTENLPMTAP